MRWSFVSQKLKNSYSSKGDELVTYSNKFLEAKILNIKHLNKNLLVMIKVKSRDIKGKIIIGDNADKVKNIFGNIDPKISPDPKNEVRYLKVKESGETTSVTFYLVNQKVSSIECYQGVG